jgi:hypothetical protein
MAECLVHDHVPFEAFDRVVTRNGRCATLANATFDSLGIDMPVSVRPDWYF